MWTYMLHNGFDEMEHDHKFTDQFWPSAPKARNDVYKLSDLTTKDDDGCGQVFESYIHA